MKNLIKYLIAIFSLLSGLFILNRFYDLLPGGDFKLYGLIIAYAFHPLIILTIGYSLFNKNKIIGFWILVLFQFYILIRHTLEYRTIKWPKFNLVNPDLVQELMIPYFDIIFVLELLIGLALLAVLIYTKKKKTMANNGEHEEPL